MCFNHMHRDELLGYVDKLAALAKDAKTKDVLFSYVKQSSRHKWDGVVLWNNFSFVQNLV